MLPWTNDEIKLNLDVLILIAIPNYSRAGKCLNSRTADVFLVPVNASIVLKYIWMYIYFYYNIYECMNNITCYM